MTGKNLGIFAALASLALLLSLLPGSMPGAPVAHAGDQGWSSMILPEVVGAGKIRDLAIVNANIAFAATSEAVSASGSSTSYIVRTSDGGVTWKPAGNFNDLNASSPIELHSGGNEALGPQLSLAASPGTEIFLAVSPNFAIDRTLFVAVSDITATRFQQVYRSKDGGDTFKIVGGANFCRPGEQIRAISVAPNYTETADSSVVVGTLDPADNAQGGLYFYQTGFGGGWSAKTGASDVYAAVFTGGTSLVVVAVNDTTVGLDPAAEFRCTVISGTVNLPNSSPMMVPIGPTQPTIGQDTLVFDLAFPSNWSAGTSTDTNIIAYSDPPPPIPTPTATATATATPVATATATPMATATATPIKLVTGTPIAANPTPTPTSLASTTPAATTTATATATATPTATATATPAFTSVPAEGVNNRIRGIVPNGAIYRRTGTTPGYATVASSNTYGFASLAMTGNASTGTVFAGAEVAPGAVAIALYSVDGGQTWNNMTAGDRYGIDGVAPAGASMRISVGIGGANAVYVGTGGARGGVFKSPNLGSNWVDCAVYSDAIDTYVDWDVIDPNNLYIVYRTSVASETHMFRTTDAGSSWRRVSRTSNLQKARASKNVAADRAVWASVAGVNNGQVRRSIDGGYTWNATPVDPSDTVTATNIFAESDVRAWVVLSNGQIAQTQDGGNTWTLSTTSPTASIVSIQQSPNFASDNTLFGMLDSITPAVWVSRDAGSSWSQLGAVPPGNNRGNVLASPTYKEDKLVYAFTQGVSGGMFKLADDGTTNTTSSWTQLATPLDMQASSYDPALNSSTGAMVGTPAFAATTLFVPVGNRIASCLDVKTTMLQWRAMPVSDSTTVGSVYTATTANRVTARIIGTTVALWTNGAANTIATLTDSSVAPRPLSPEKGAFDIPRVVGLAWSGVPGATTYEVQLGLVPSLVGATKMQISDVGTETSRWYGGEGMTPGGTYYWRMRAYAPVTGPWSETWSFTVIGGVRVTPTPVPIDASKLALAEGWNLVSLPKSVAESSGPMQAGGVSTILRSFAAVSTIERVYGYSGGTWHLATFGSGSPAGDLTEMAPGNGYWVKTTAPTTVPLNYRPVSPLDLPPTYELPAGWSLIGYSTLALTQQQPVNVYLTSLAGKWPTLYRYDAISGYSLAKPGYGFTDIEVLRGYWIYLTSPGVLVP